MATVKVLLQATGCWSDDIAGVDKEYFVKSVLDSCFARSAFSSLLMTEDCPDANELIKHLELDFLTVCFKDIVKVEYYAIDEDSSSSFPFKRVLGYGDYITHQLTLDNINTDIHSLMISIKILKGLIDYYKDKKQSHLIPVMEAIIKAGNVPSGASDDYVLILKFD